MEKTLGIKDKFTKPSGGSVGDLSEQQVFDWSLEISGGQVTFSSSALRDDCLFTLEDVRRIFRSAEGCQMVELSHLEGEKFKSHVLTGELKADEAA